MANAPRCVLVSRDELEKRAGFGGRGGGFRRAERLRRVDLLGGEQTGLVPGHLLGLHQVRVLDDHRGRFGLRISEGQPEDRLIGLYHVVVNQKVLAAQRRRDIRHLFGVLLPQGLLVGSGHGDLHHVALPLLADDQVLEQRPGQLGLLGRRVDRVEVTGGVCGVVDGVHRLREEVPVEAGPRPHDADQAARRVDVLYGRRRIARDPLLLTIPLAIRS